MDKICSGKMKSFNSVQCFCVNCCFPKLNIFLRKFSISGSHPDRRDFTSYQFVYKTEFGKYSLNAVDASLDPGPKRPFNFFGHFNEVIKFCQFKENLRLV